MNELYHHGILGMHWGIRRTPEELGHEPARPKTSNAKKMSDEELRAAINRLRMEEDYRNLLERATPKHEPKKKGAIASLVSEAISQLAKKSVNRLTDNIVSSMFEKKFNPESYLNLDLNTADPATLKKAVEYMGQRSAYEKLTGNQSVQNSAVDSQKTVGGLNIDTPKYHPPTDVSNFGMKPLLQLDYKQDASNNSNALPTFMLRDYIFAPGLN